MGRKGKERQGRKGEMMAGKRRREGVEG